MRILYSSTLTVISRRTSMRCDAYRTRYTVEYVPVWTTFRHAIRGVQLRTMCLSYTLGVPGVIAAHIGNKKAYERYIVGVYHTHHDRGGGTPMKRWGCLGCLSVTHKQPWTAPLHEFVEGKPWPAPWFMLTLFGVLQAITQETPKEIHRSKARIVLLYFVLYYIILTLIPCVQYADRGEVSPVGIVLTYPEQSTTFGCVRQLVTVLSPPAMSSSFATGMAEYS